MASKLRLQYWDSLPDDAQLALAGQALHRAAEAIAAQAECLAGGMEDGTLADRGGAEALRLLIAVVRATGPDALPAAGHA
jgi:hypothetical protein